MTTKQRDGVRITEGARQEEISRRHRERDGAPPLTVMDEPGTILLVKTQRAQIQRAAAQLWNAARWIYSGYPPNHYDHWRKEIERIAKELEHE